MATFAKQNLSASTNGRGILVGTTDTTIHTGSTTTTVYDEIWLYATNVTTSASKLTVKWGGTTEAGDFIEQLIPGESGLILVVPGLLIRGVATALIVRATAADANALVIHGYVNRIS